MPPKKPVNPINPLNPSSDGKKPDLKRPLPGGTGKNPVTPKPDSPVTKEPVPQPVPSGGSGGTKPSGRIPVTAPAKKPAPAPDDKPAARPVKSGAVSRSVFQSLKESSADNLKSANAALSMELKTQAGEALRNNGYPALADLLAAASEIDFSRAKDRSVRQWIAETISSQTANNPAAKKQLEEAAARLPENLTLGELLGLDAPLKDHPLFRAALERERLTGLFSLSSAISAQARSSFLSACENFTGTPEAFWAEIKSRPELKGDGAKDMERLFQLDALSMQNLPLVQSLEALRKKGEWKELRDLSAWDEGKWNQIVKAAGFEDGDLLAGFEGDTPAAKLAAYSARIQESLRLAFPADALKRGLENEKITIGTIPPAVRKNILKVLAAAPDLDLGTMHLEDYFFRNPKALDGIANKTEVKTELKKIQRIQRITPDFAKMKVLLDAGLDSAHSIVSTPLPVFMKKFSSALGGESQARAYYMKAGAMSAQTAGIMGALTQAAAGIQPAAVGDAGKDVLKEMPSLANLFGSLDFCDCKQCASVHSPAAYLVDLLQFLRKAESKPLNPAAMAGDALSILRKRRPDLEHIKLNCDNTNTALPYVDLVNEILEYCVVSGKLDKDAARDTEDMSAEELNVSPQYVNDAAYDKLAGEIYPAPLPFNRPVEISRAYLEHLGSSRYELLDAFHKAAQPAGAATRIACEYLKIDENERKILAGEGITPVRAYFGYAADSFGGKPWDLDLAQMPNFLKRTGLAAADVAELIKTRFINADKTAFIDLPAGEADVAKASLKNFTVPKFEKLNRFIRLQRKLGWTTQELDSALAAFKAQAIDNSVLEKISIAVRLKDSLHAKLPVLLSFWAPIETAGEHALYPKLFLNKAVFNPVDPAFKLNAQGTEVLSAGTITDHAPAILAALGVNAQDFAAIRAACNIPDGDGNSPLKPALSIENLSKLYRHAAFARALRIPVRDFLSLKALASDDPFANPAATLAFAEKARKVRDSKFKPAQLDYLLRHISDPSRPYAPAEETAALFIKQLSEDLKKIKEENAVPEDASGEILANKFAAVFEPALANQAMGIVDGTSALSKPEQDSFIEQNFAVFVSPADAKAMLTGPSNLPPDQLKEARLRFTLTHLIEYLRNSLAKSSVVQALAERFAIEAEILWVLLEQILESSFVSTASMMSDFLTLMDGLPANISAQIDSYRKLHKIAMIVSGFSITPAEASHLQHHGADFAGFDWNAVPMSENEFTPAHFKQWERLYDLFSFRDRIPQSEAGLTDIFAAATIQDALENLRKASGWDDAEMQYAAGNNGLALTLDDFRNEIALLRLETCVRLAGRIGLSVKYLFNWSAGTPDSAQSKDIVQSVRAKYSEEEWLDAGKSLNDRLREMQRQALVAYLLPRTTDVDTPEQMFEYFLIDVNMNPVMKTSRIKQAISAVQTFIQRCLMNLETEVDAGAIDAGRWEWMKNYRVWEANRKVFLYPENWIEPELRDDKSPFFIELEAELLQNDISLETAERAFLNYLEKLDEVARLEMCGIYHQVEGESGGDEDALHCFGRTFNSPHAYYYRSYSFKTGRWTPWEKLTLDIEGEQLVPIVFNRRLYLFWPVFEQKSTDGPKNSDGEVQTRNYWSIKMCWSEYLNGKWTAKKSTKAIWTSWPAPEKLDPPAIEKHFFSAKIFTNGSGSTLSLEMYVDEIPDAINVSLSTTYGGYLQFQDRVGDYVSYDHGDDGGGTFISAPKPEDSWLDRETFQMGGDLKIPQDGKGQVPVLNHLGFISRMLFPHDLINDFYDNFFPFFFQDTKRVYFVRPKFDGPEPKMAIPDVLRNPSAYKPFLPKSGVVKRISMGDAAVIPAQDGSSGAFKKSAAPLTQMKISIGSAVKTSLPSFQEAVSGNGNAAAQIKPGFDASSIMMQKLYLHFETFFHPHTIDFIRGLNREGVAGLLTLENQKLRNDQGLTTVFEQAYEPADIVHWDRPREIVDFSSGSPYAVYNWELFFHIPLLIAASLVREGRYDDAFSWFHTIFNPAADSTEPSPRRYWNVLPFFNNHLPGKEQIQQMLTALSYTGTSDKSLLKQKAEVKQQVEEWRDNPFNPHLIARMRITAYQKNVVMKYIDALIGKADQLFAMDTIETINEATQLYVMAANMLGRRPEELDTKDKAAAMTFDDLKDKLDDFSNALVQVENEFPFAGGDEPPAYMFYSGKVKETNFSKAAEITKAEPGSTNKGYKLHKVTGLEFGKAKPDWESLPPGFGINCAFYFCIPKNDKLLSYWDTVADRLFKIRHGLNLEGIERPLALFEPPIDPALLVRARALGLDLTSVLGDLRSPAPRCRFSYLMQKALELCAEVKSLGNALLSALEKKDSEEIAQVRQRHETALLRAAREVKKKQIEEARLALSGLERQRETTNTRYQFYKNIAYRNSQEDRYIDELEEARRFQQMAQGSEASGGQLANIPDFTTGSGGMGPVAETTFGGSNLAKAASAMASAFNFFAAIHTQNSTMASIVGGWHRRWDDWKLQEKLAAKELAQIEKQILAAEIRIDMAGKELENHDLQIENSEEVESFLSNKFTSRDLYGWMISRISSVYFQVYKLAYDLAKKAERAWANEYGPGPGGFVKFGYWDSLKKGLLSGEELWLDLKRMEAAAFEAPRDYEITKNISLGQTVPMALVSLKETGRCEFILPEELFTADYPGHYNRRIRNVTITLPCVAGPYASVNATLTLLENQIRISPSVSDGFAELEDEEDPRFIKNYGPVQSIATSTGQNDAGLFELNFRDERYLPFEGAGTASRWRLELRKDSNSFDLDTVSDVILTMSYRAREGGEVLAKAAREAVIAPEQENLTRLFSVRHEFPMEWHRFFSPAETDPSQKLELPLGPERFPFTYRSRDIQIQSAEIYLKLKTAYPGSGQMLKLSLTPPSGAPVTAPLQSIASVLGGIPRGVFDVSSGSAGTGTWMIEAKEADVKLIDSKLRQPASASSALQRLKRDQVQDLFVLIKYSAQ